MHMIIHSNHFNGDIWVVGLCGLVSVFTSKRLNYTVRPPIDLLIPGMSCMAIEINMICNIHLPETTFAGNNAQSHHG